MQSKTHVYCLYSHRLQKYTHGGGHGVALGLIEHHDKAGRTSVHVLRATKHILYLLPEAILLVITI